VPFKKLRKRGKKVEQESLAKGFINNKNGKENYNLTVYLVPREVQREGLVELRKRARSWA